jgi:hypothetical protein
MLRSLANGRFRIKGDAGGLLRWFLPAAIALFVGMGLTGRAVGAEAIWIGPANGSWTTAANWSTGAVPNSSTNVHIDDNAAQNSTVTSSANISVPLLTIDPGDTLVASGGISGGTFTEVNGTLNTPGAMFGNAYVLGTGRIEMPASTSQISNLYYVAPGGLVRGRGTISVQIDSHNDGEIRADILGQLLTISMSPGATVANSGRMTAVGGGTLKITALNSASGATLWGGRIESNAGSTVILGTSGANTIVNDVTIAGIDDSDPLTATPVINFASPSLTDPTFEGTFSVPTGSSAGFTGLVTNKAQITMAPATSSPYFFPGTDTSLTGGGSFLMQEGFLFSGTAGTTHLYNIDNTIHGTGTITTGFGFTNRGTINADVASALSLNLTSSAAGVTDVNSGTMRSSGGGYLRIGAVTLQNYEGGTLGKVIAGQNSVVELNAATISGGIVQCEGPVAATQGRFRLLGNSAFQDVTVQGTFRTTSNVAATMSGQVNNQGVIAAPLNVTSSLQLNGTGEVLIDTTWLTLSSTARLTNQQNLIHGSGTTGTIGTFINRGTVRADGTLSFTAPGLKLDNGGRLEAGPGGTLDLSHLDVSNSDGATGGTVFAADGGTVMLSTIHGGTLATAGTGVIKIATSSNLYGLDSVHNTGNLQTTNTKISANITNDGLITGTVSMYQFVQFSGTGTWDALGTQASALGLLVNGPQHTILGDGPINVVAFRNEGTVTAKGTSVFTLGAGTIQNYGLIDTPLGTTFAANANGGTIDNEGTLRSAGATTITATGGFTNHGTGIVDVSGTLSLVPSTTLRNGAGGLVKGSGTISRSGGGTALVNEGIVAPGDGIKTLSIGGDFQQLATGRLKMDIDTGPSLTNDVLAIDGAASLAGALEVLLSAGDVVTIGDSFTLLTATQGVSGVFSDLALPALGSGMFWNVQYLPNDVRITAMQLIPGDYNYNGTVDAADYVLWRKYTNTATTLPNDSTLGTDESDYGVWRAHFGQPTGSGASAPAIASVPEPTTLIMLIMTTLYVCVRRGVVARTASN